MKKKKEEERKTDRNMEIMYPKLSVRFYDFSYIARKINIYDLEECPLITSLNPTIDFEMYWYNLMNIFSVKWNGMNRRHRRIVFETFVSDLFVFWFLLLFLEVGGSQKKLDRYCNLEESCSILYSFWLHGT